MSDTAEKLERDVEARRSDVESTLDELKGRMSVDQMISDVGRFVGIPDARATLRNAGQQVQANPIAFGMIGLGIAWLVMGSNTTRNRSHTPYSGSSPDWDRKNWGGPKVDSDDRQGFASRAVETAGDAVGRVSDSVGNAASRIGDMASRAEEKLRSGFTGTRDSADHLRHSVTTRLEEQPLLIGGIALAIGAVIGAALPRTEAEDRMMGKQRDQLLDEAKQATAALRDRVTDATQQTYDAALDTARDEGLLPEDGETLTGKLSAVAGAALTEAKKQVEPLLHGDDAKSKDSETSAA